MLKTFLARFARDEKGASMVEYAVALLVVTGVGVTVMSVMGTEVGENVQAACNVLTTDATNAGCTVTP